MLCPIDHRFCVRERLLSHFGFISGSDDYLGQSNGRIVIMCRNHMDVEHDGENKRERYRAKIFHRRFPNGLLPSTPRSGLLAILC
jgi:hypothetical protein